MASKHVHEIGEDSSLTSLVVDLKGVHPDDAFSSIPYEKGHLFLKYLETIVGGPDCFEAFLRAYFDEYKFKSLDTTEFRRFFENHFKDCRRISDIDWDTWLHTPGMPSFVPAYDRTLLTACEELKNKLIHDTENFSKTHLDLLSPSQKIVMLQLISDEESLPLEKVKKLGEVFDIKNTKNSEMLFRWYRICMKAHFEDVVDDVLAWISEVGRIKFVLPLYRDLFNFEQARPKAIANFLKHKGAMMHVTAYTVGKDLKLY